MIKVSFQSDDYCYYYVEKTGDFILSSKRYKIHYNLTGDDAILFKQHLEFISRKPDDRLNKRINKLIAVYLMYNVMEAVDDDKLKTK